MQKFLVRTLIVISVLVLIVPIAIATGGDFAGREGLRVGLNRGFTIGATNITVDALKLVDGGFRETTIHFRYDTFLSYVDATFVMPGDADQLEVSDDLGWGGLHGTVYVHLVNRITGTSELVPLVLNLDLFATANGSTHNGTFFSREADAHGTITLGGRTLDFNLPLGPANWEVGLNFTDQWPGL